MLLALAFASSACQKSAARSVTHDATPLEPALAAPHNDTGAALVQARAPVEAQPAEAKPAVRTQAPEPAEAQPVEAKPGALAQQPEMKMLSELVQGSPYVAVLQHLTVEVSRKDESEETHRYRARVLETIRGPKLSEISYVIVTEPDETAELNKEPVIVMLCRGEDGYYWPGVDSTMPSNTKTRAVARQAAKQAPPGQQTFANCQ